MPFNRAYQFSRMTLESRFCLGKFSGIKYRRYYASEIVFEIFAIDDIDDLRKLLKLS